MSVVPLNGRQASRGQGVAKRNVVAALDVGTTKISCLIAEVQPARHRVAGVGAAPQVKVLGLGHQASRGIKGGVVVNVDEAERVIRLAVDAAERMAQTSISEVHVAVSGGKPQSRAFSATVKTQTGVVSPRDRDTVVALALAKADAQGRHVMKLAPNYYTLDGGRLTGEPLGLHGGVLGVEVGLVTVDPAPLRNLAMAIARAHLAIAGQVLAPHAAARAALVDDELELGTLVIEMGGAVTGLSLFHDGKLVAADVVPVGGLHVTHDIARGLSTSIAHAERMKTLWGSVFATAADDRDLLSVPLLGERGADMVNKVPRSALSAIIRPRLEETFELIQMKLALPAFARFGGVRVVLTGGASQLTGLRDFAQTVLARPVRQGSVAALSAMPDTARHPGFAVASGLVLHAAAPEPVFAMPQAAATALTEAHMGYARRVGRWLAEAL